MTSDAATSTTGIKETHMRLSPCGLRIGACTIAMACGAAFAQTPPAGPADCHRIITNAERLACYDAVSGRAAEAGREAGPATGAVPREPAAQTRGADTAARAGPPTLSMI